MKKNFILLYFILLVAQAFSQPGSIDPTFNPTDRGFGFGGGPNDDIYTTAIQSDGKIIIGGQFFGYNGVGKNRIARINPDGSLDESFNPGTGANYSISSITLQSDGKILIGGEFSSYDGTQRRNIARLNPDGSLDRSFDPGMRVNFSVQTIAIQSDGKIIVVGYYTYTSNIARLNTDGTLDLGFNPGTGANSIIFTTALQSDGKIIIGGHFTSYNGTPRNRIARLNADGSLDAGFNPSTGVNGEGLFVNIQSISLQSDGKILIGGNFTSYNGTPRNGIARLNPDGSLDLSFDPGIGASDYIRTITLQGDGKIIIGGGFTSYNGTKKNDIARINSDGSLDASFDPGFGAGGPILSTALQSDGKIIISGQFRKIGRLNSDGSLDAGFNPSTGANGTVTTTAIQSDGKILIGGNFTSYNGTPRNGIARLNTDGSLDASFNPSSVAGVGVSSMSLQSDGKILIAQGKIITRLNSDGSLDASFNPGSGAERAIYTTALQSDGKILIGGAFRIYNGMPRNAIARLNSDGSLDASFIGRGAQVARSTPYVQTIALQNDGKILIGGEFNSYDFASRRHLARLNPDGSVDLSFDPGTSVATSLSGTPYNLWLWPYISTIALQSDGKIIIGGVFTFYKDKPINRIARLNTDGSLDASFDPGKGVDGIIYTTALQSDGKIIIGGDFTSYDGTSRRHLARLNTDGSLDTDFNPGTGANSSIITTSIQSDGNIIIGGSFTSYNGTGRNRIARVIGDAGSCTQPTFLNNAQIVLDANCNMNDGNISIIPASGVAPFMYSINGGATYVTGANTGFTFNNLVPGTYQLRLKDANGCESAIVEKTVSSIYGAPTFLNNSQIVLDASCNTNDGQISIIPTSATGPFKYSIDGGATYVAGPDAGYTFLNLAPGNYQLRLMNGNGCESDIVEKSVIERYGQPCPSPRPKTNGLNKGMITGEYSMGEKLKVSVYPNPGKGRFTLQLLQPGTGKGELSIFDAKGTLVQKSNINMSKGGLFNVNLEGKAPGLYYFKLVSPMGTSTAKVVKQ